MFNFKIYDINYEEFSDGEIYDFKMIANGVKMDCSYENLSDYNNFSFYVAHNKDKKFINELEDLTEKHKMTILKELQKLVK